MIKIFYLNQQKIKTKPTHSYGITKSKNNKLKQFKLEFFSFFLFIPLNVTIIFMNCVTYKHTSTPTFVL